VTRCRACNRDASDGSRFCPHCGAALASGAPSAAPSQAEGISGQDASPTRTVHGDAAGHSPSSGAGARRSSPPGHSSRPISGSPSEGRFLPGTMLAGRYRIFGLVGKGAWARSIAPTT